MALRAIAPEEWPIWREVRLEALREAPDAFSSRLADWQGAPEARWRARLEDVPLNVVAFADEAPIGQVSGMNLDSEGSVQLISLWVSPEFRSRGVSDTLVGAVVAWARQQGASRVTLTVRRENARAVGFYKRCGFSFTRRPVEDAAEVEMALDLGE